MRCTGVSCVFRGPWELRHICGSPRPRLHDRGSMPPHEILKSPSHLDSAAALCSSLSVTESQSELYDHFPSSWQKDVGFGNNVSLVTGSSISSSLCAAEKPKALHSTESVTGDLSSWLQSSKSNKSREEEETLFYANTAQASPSGLTLSVHVCA